MVSLPLALLFGSCRPEPTSRSERTPLLSEEWRTRTDVSFSCTEALEERFGKRWRWPQAARDHHIRELSPNRFEIRSVVDLLDAEGDRRLRSRFRCVVELRGKGDEFFWPPLMVVLTVDALDSPRRHALWPWPGLDGLVSALRGRAVPSGPAK